MQSHNEKFFNFTNEELEDFYKMIGDNVKYYRELKKMTQQELAFNIGHNSVGHIAKAELCKYNKHFSLEQLYKISHVLDVPLTSLLQK